MSRVNVKQQTRHDPSKQASIKSKQRQQLKRTVTLNSLRHWKPNQPSLKVPKPTESTESPESMESTAVIVANGTAEAHAADETDDATEAALVDETDPAAETEILSPCALPWFPVPTEIETITAFVTYLGSVSIRQGPGK